MDTIVGWIIPNFILFHQKVTEMYKFLPLPFGGRMLQSQGLTIRSSNCLIQKVMFIVWCQKATRVPWPNSDLVQHYYVLKLGGMKAYQKKKTVICNDGVENELHALLECTLYNDIRQTLLTKLAAKYTCNGFYCFTKRSNWNLS